jgi:hypothetical protein
LDCGESEVQTQPVPSQVAEAFGSGGPLESVDSNSEPELSISDTEASPEPEPIKQRDPPQVPFPFTWSESGFLPGGALPDNKEACEALLSLVQFDRDLDTTELIKRALLARNQYFLDRCSAINCDRIVDHKTVCKLCNIAKYCSQECAVFDLAHRHPHPEYPEVSDCAAIENLDWVVVDPSTETWDQFADDICDSLITYN